MKRHSTITDERLADVVAHFYAKVRVEVLSLMKMQVDFYDTAPIT